MTEEDMSPSNLTLRLLRKMDQKIDALDKKVDEFRRETNERFVALEGRLGRVEDILAAMSRHVFWLTEQVRKHDRRLHKLETRPAK